MNFSMKVTFEAQMLSRWLSHARRDCFPICFSSPSPSLLLPSLPKSCCDFVATGQNPSNRLQRWSHFVIINLKTMIFLYKLESGFFLSKCCEAYINHFIKMKNQSYLKTLRREHSERVSYSRSHQGQSLKTVDCAQAVHLTVTAFANVSQGVVTRVTVQGSLKV